MLIYAKINDDLSCANLCTNVHCNYADLLENNNHSCDNICVNVRLYYANLCNIFASDVLQIAQI